MRILFLLILVVPVVEMYVLINVGGVIGAIPTIALVVLTAAAGAFMIRLQGVLVVRRLQEKFKQGEMPAEEMLTGVALLLAGAFLLTPGFVTDGVGFLLLLPVFRRGLFRFLISRGVLASVSPGARGFSQDAQGRVTIEGDYHVGDDKPDDRIL